MQVLNDKTIKLNYLKVDNLEITGASNYSFLHEKTYNKSPERAVGNGAINNLNSYPTFISQHLKFDFNFMPIDMYRAITKLLLSKNEFFVTAYDLVYDKVYQGKMYFYPQEMPSVFVSPETINGVRQNVVRGIKNTTIELVSTNDTDEDFSIVYHSNIPNNDYTVGINAFMNQEIVLGEATSFVYANKKLVKWATNADGSGTVYSNGDVITVTEDLVLYAVWQDSEEYYLSYDYNGGVTDNLPLSKTVKLGQAIGELPTTTRKGYTFGGWYQQLSGQGTQLTQDTIWNINANIVIYAKWIPINYTIRFDLGGGKLLDKDNNEVTSITQGYQTTIEIYNYTPQRDGYTFKGYYIDSSFNNAYSFTTMPYNGYVTDNSNVIYLKWEQNQ